MNDRLRVRRSGAFSGAPPSVARAASRSTHAPYELSSRSADKLFGGRSVRPPEEAHRIGYTTSRAVLEDVVKGAVHHSPNSVP
jgi:hypothetical protein